MNIRNICNTFSCTDVHTDDDYMKVLRGRHCLFIVMLVIGLITSSIAAMAEFLNWDVKLSSHILGFYTGVGSGITFAAAIFLLRLRKIIKDPKLLRSERIKATDERVREISRRSLAAAGYVLLIAVYLVCLIGGLFYPELLAVLAILACVFVAALAISYFIYNKIIM